MPDRADLLRAKARLEAAGVEVLGVTDYHIIESIYFFDPNGIRLELTVRAIEDAELRRLSLDVRSQLAAWTAEKKQLRALP